MKKYFFFAIAAVAVVFASCKPSQEADKLVLSLSQNYAEIGVDEELRLRTTISPAGAAVANLTYVSTDPSVVTVSGSGLLTGVKLGEAYVIVSAENAESDSCKVIVSDMAVYNNFNIADYGLFGEFTPIEGTDTVFMLRASAGAERTPATCQLNTIYLRAWDGNANFVSGAGFAGDGFVISVDNFPVYVIKKWEAAPDKEGYYLSTGGFIVREQKEGEPLYLEAVARPGSMDIQSCGDIVRAQYSSDTTLTPDFDKWGELNVGAFLVEPFASQGHLSNSYGFFSGKVNRAAYFDAYVDSVGNEVPASWAVDVDFASLQPDRIWGFRFDTALYISTYVEGKGGEIELIQPYDYATVHRVFDEDGLFGDEEAVAAPAARKAARKQAAVRELGDMKKLHRGVYLDKNGKVVPAADRVAKK